MSIELQNPKTDLEKADAASNFVAQMLLAHKIRDDNQFMFAHKMASDLLFELVRSLDEKQ